MLHNIWSADLSNKNIDIVLLARFKHGSTVKEHHLSLPAMYLESILVHKFSIFDNIANIIHNRSLTPSLCG